MAEATKKRHNGQLKGLLLTQTPTDGGTFIEVEGTRFRVALTGTSGNHCQLKFTSADGESAPPEHVKITRAKVVDRLSQEAESPA